MIAILMCLLAGFVGRHPESHSSSRVTVTGTRVELELLCQTRSLAETLAVDSDGDERLDAAEFERARAVVLPYLRGHYRIETNGTATLAPVGEALVIAPDDTGTLDEQRVLARFTFDAQGAFTGLVIHADLFVETNPYHRDTASVAWNDDEPQTWLFGEGVDTWNFEPAAVRRPSVFAGYVRLGFEHILSGYDHIAFLIALIVVARGLRSMLGVITAFAAAHSITLACAALGVLDPPSRLVEMAIALSIAYVAIENMVLRKPAARWVEAFLFGLVHGLGFAGFLGESLIYEPLKTTALVGFNCGVELGQLSVVGVLALLVGTLPGDRNFEGDPRAWFAPRWLRLAASSLVALLGLAWFADRAGWLP